MDFFAFFVRNVFLISVLKPVRLPDICIFDGEVNFKALINRSPLNKPEVFEKVICLCAHR